MKFNKDEVIEGRLITDVDEERPFYGVTVNEEEWANCEEFIFTADDLSFRGLSRVWPGLIIVFDSGGMTVDLDKPNAFRLVDQQESEEDDIIEKFLVQPIGEKEKVVISKTSTKHLIPRLVQDHRIATNLGQSEKVLPLRI